MTDKADVREILFGFSNRPRKFLYLYKPGLTDIKELNPLDASDSHNPQISFTLSTLLQGDLLFHFTILHNFFNNFFLATSFFN